MIQIKNKKGDTIFEYAHGIGKDFDSADLRGVNMAGGLLEGAMFSDANLEEANLEGCDFYWAIFYRANLQKSTLKDAIVRGVDLKLANLRGADLRNADFSQDNLGGSTQLQGADLTEALVEGAKFQGTEYDSSTKFPLGFNPENNGMRFVMADEIGDTGPSS